MYQGSYGSKIYSSLIFGNKENQIVGRSQQRDYLFRRRSRAGKNGEQSKSGCQYLNVIYFEFQFNNFQQQLNEMYFGFWNNGTFTSPWHFYVPFQDINLANCTVIPPTQTHIEQNRQLRSFERDLPQEKKGLIDLSKDDLVNAGYQTTKKLWTQEQDQLLLKLIDQDKIPWKQIELHIPERTQKMCYSRYRRLLSQTKQSWTKEQDQKIKELVGQYGQNWKQFTFHFKNRSSKQLKQRYTNYLRPQIRRDHWSLQEDLKIIQCINKYGKKWKQIQKELGNRTDNQIKNRYYGRLKILYKIKVVKERRKNLEKNRKINQPATENEINHSLAGIERQLEQQKREN